MLSYPIIWSPTARISYYQILEYLDQKWTVKELTVFINRTEEVLRHISHNPLLYPKSRQADLHRCIVVKQITLFYRIKQDTVQLLVFWDNRQDPAKLPL